MARVAEKLSVSAIAAVCKTPQSNDPNTETPSAVQSNRGSLRTSAMSGIPTIFPTKSVPKTTESPAKPVALVNTSGSAKGSSTAKRSLVRHGKTETTFRLVRVYRNGMPDHGINPWFQRFQQHDEALGV